MREPIHRAGWRRRRALAELASCELASYAVASLPWLLVAAAAGAPRAQEAPSAGVFRVVDLGDRVRVEQRDALVTEYRYRGQPKPILYPLHGPGGVAVTRQWPLAEAPGEERDHQHHRALWFAHGAVNGHDFWAEHAESGQIEHAAWLEATAEGATAVLRTRNVWRAHDGATVCHDERRLCFYDVADAVLFDYDVTLLATEGPLRLGDTKEGTMAIRLAPTLRLRGDVAAGHCVNAAGDRDGDVWGQRAGWVDYYGPIDGGVVGVAIFDHPENVAHPTWWHARDYGLFAANPFGAHDFEDAPAGTGDVVVPAGESLTLRYRFFLHRGDTEAAAVAARFDDYASAGASEDER
ncbi:MAG: PmoA family protein [Planctomycetota bacterium]